MTFFPFKIKGQWASIAADQSASSTSLKALIMGMWVKKKYLRYGLMGEKQDRNYREKDKGNICK